jgi:hypothetical protein
MFTVVNIRNITDPTMTHILGALLKAKTEKCNDEAFTTILQNP